MRIPIRYLLSAGAVLAALALGATSASADWQPRVPGSLSVDVGNHDSQGSIAWVGGKLYAAWVDRYAGFPDQVVTARLDGDSWTLLDGTGPSGPSLNTDESLVAESPMIASVGGVPYVVYQQSTASNIFQLHVAKFDGSKWVAVGGVASYSTADAGQSPPAITDVVGTPYIAYTSKFSGGQHIMVGFWDGSTWVQEGQPLDVDLSAPVYVPEGISMTTVNGEPFVVFTADSQGSEPIDAYAATWDAIHGRWVQEGGILNADPSDLAYNPSVTTVDGTPYVAWDELDSQSVSTFRVARLDGTSWTEASTPLDTPRGGSITGPVISSYQGAAIVAWGRGSASHWVTYTAAVRGLTVSPISSISPDIGYYGSGLAITGDGSVPYLATSDVSSSPAEVKVLRLVPDFLVNAAQASPTTATLDATVDDFGFKLPIGFRYGRGSSLITTLTPQQSPGVGRSTIAATVTGLAPGTQ